MVSQRSTNWTKGGLSSFTSDSDVAEHYLSVTDIKHYLYCPRIVYFERVLHAEPELGAQQKESAEMHRRFEEVEARRKGARIYAPEFEKAEKFFRVPLLSRSLRLRGTLDCLAKVGSEYVPIDYKNNPSNRGKVWSDHKYQLVAYALLVEENLGTIVKRGYVNYVPEKLAVRVDITPTMKTYVRRIVKRAWRIVEEELLPPIRVSSAKCTGGCGYRWICRTA